MSKGTFHCTLEDLDCALCAHLRRKHTAAYFAAMYLLTASANLAARSQNCYSATGIALNRVEVRGINPHDYTLLAAAKDIYNGEFPISLHDLLDAEIVDEEAFTLIVNAILIARCGCSAPNVRRQKGGRRGGMSLSM